MKTLVLAIAGIAASAGVALASCAKGAEQPGAGEGRASDDAGAGNDGPFDGGAPDAPSADASADGATRLVDTCGDGGAPVAAWVADPHLCLTVYAEKMTLARQLAISPNGDLFIASSGSILADRDLDKNGTIEASESTVFVADGLGLNHGLAFSPDGAFVYASSETTIYRWAYAAGDRFATGAPQIVVSGMPTGGHVSRTLLFDAEGRLYVNVGSANDVDLESDLALRSQVRRFTLPKLVAPGGAPYESGEVYASGLRSEVGLAIDSKGRVWGVENGSDGMYLPTSATDEPAEELNQLDSPGSHFFGFSRCWTEFGFDGGLGNKTSWAYLGPSATTDAWCRDPANVQAPAAAMRAHWAPLGVAEYTGNSLPWNGDLFITSHGSAPGRFPRVGRLVARAHLEGAKVSSITPVVGHLVDGGLEEGTWDARPVDICTGPDGALYFSDDQGSRVFRLGYRP